MKSPTSKTKWKKFALILSSLLISLLVIEAAVRFMEPARLLDEADRAIDAPWDEDGNSFLHVRSSNPALVYELRPSASVYVEKFDRTFTTNAAGFRDYEFPESKAEGAYRIAAIGDSVTFGWDQALEETFPKLLEAGFADAGLAQVEVFNFGVGGYNSLQEVELIRTKALSFAPDLLLLAYVMNDDSLQGQDGGLARHFNRTFWRSYDLLKVRVQRLYRHFGPSPTEEAMSKLGALSAELGIPVVVVIFPLMQMEEDGSYSTQETHDLVHALALEHGFGLLDLFEPFRSAGFEAVRGDVIHPNRKGNEIAAQQILEYLIETRQATGLPSPRRSP